MADSRIAPPSRRFLMRKHPAGVIAFSILLAAVACEWPLTAALPSAVQAQVPASAKRPLTYDVVDYWKSIQGTRLTEDGQWLAYATTAQSEDGELVVRNLRTGREFKQARGTSPQFTPDAKFVVFTVAQPKAEEERATAANNAAGGEPAAEPAAPAQGRGRGANPRREPRTGFGIMTLPDGQVKTFDKVGSFRIPEKSSTWVAYYKGVGGAS